jgi:lipooligosaccharide transport system ATP-binding protein
MDILNVDGLVKRYNGQTVVNALSFSLRAGQCLGLLGPNGAGKTTTIRMLLGLTRPDAGRITCLGLDLPQAAREARVRIGIVPQMDNLDPDFSATENLFVFGRYYGLGEAQLRARIPGLLEFAGLSHKADARIGGLSGGMKRRLTLARALINDPDLIILDEPTTGLDPQARHLMWAGLRSLLARGKTLLLTTHFMEEAERLADHLVIIDHGRKITEGSPRALIEREIEPHVFEVHGDGAAQWSALDAAALCCRQETVGDSRFFYTHDAAPLLASLNLMPSLRYQHRPSNLEDVFLKLTGRDLRD